MRILVTGSAGFIGSQITELLLAAGHDVAELDCLLPAAHGEAGMGTGDVRIRPRCGQRCGRRRRVPPVGDGGATKLAQEHLAAAWARAVDGTAVALRYHNVYGPRMPRDTPYSGVAAMSGPGWSVVNRPPCSRTAASAVPSSTPRTSPGPTSWRWGIPTVHKGR